MTPLSSTLGVRDGDEDSSAPDARIGTVLDEKYRLESVLGIGGMGVVYAARHLRIGRRVAIKFLLPQYANKAQILRRFEIEAQAAGSLAHENIAAVHDSGQASDGSRFLVMDLLEGEDCDRLLEREGPLPAARVVNIVLQVCRGLDVAHGAGIVHRDLKPSNLFLSKRGDGTDLVKILDFGIAKLRPPGADSATVTGLAMGTAHYMSPEQARGEKSLDHRTDIYTLGVILYELLTGKKPHEGDTYLRIVHSILHEKPRPIASLREGLPVPLVAVVDKAMRTDPEGRHQTVADLGDSLIPFAGTYVPPFNALGAVQVAATCGATRPSGEEPESLTARHPGPSSGTKPKRVRWAVVIGIIAAALLAALFAHWNSTPGDSTTDRAPEMLTSAQSEPSRKAPVANSEPAASSALSEQTREEAGTSGHEDRDAGTRYVPVETKRRAAQAVVSQVPPPVRSTMLPPATPAAGVVDIDPNPNF